MYYKKTAKNGRVMYYQGNKLVSKNSIPEEAVIQDRDYELAPQLVDARGIESANVNPESPEETQGSKECLVCGEEATCTRFVNLQVVGLCQDHYHQLTLGEIVQAIREKQTA